MLDCEGSAAGRGYDYEEKYVAKKPISPSEDHRKEDRKEYKVSGTSTLHLAAPSVASCGSSAQHNCCELWPRDGADVCRLQPNRSQFRAKTITGRTQQQQPSSQCEGDASKESSDKFV